MDKFEGLKWLTYNDAVIIRILKLWKIYSKLLKNNQAKFFLTNHTITLRLYKTTHIMCSKPWIERRQRTNRKHREVVSLEGRDLVWKEKNTNRIVRKNVQIFS